MSTLHAAAGRLGRGGILAAGIAASGLFITTLLFLMSRTTYDTWAAFLLVPILIGLTLPALARQADREGDRRLFWLLVAALVLKLAGGLAFYAVFGSNTDASKYHKAGIELAEGFRSGRFAAGYESVVGTEFIKIFTGIVYMVIGTTRIGASLLYSWLAFWGLFLFYRAFTLSVPEGRSRTYARLLFFFPSMLFWPSSIGKEAWMILALGMAAYGGAKMLARSAWRGLPVAALGLWLAALVRPHVAGMVGLGLAAAFLLRPPRPELRQLAPIAKLIGLIGVTVLAVIMVLRAQSFLEHEGFQETSATGVIQTLESVSQRADTGGSVFDPIVVRSPSQLQVAFGTVLYRPMLFEAHNVESLVAALEATLLLILTVTRIRWIWSALRSMRRAPFIALVVSYTLMFVVAFASFPNFGLLVRQRVQLLPFFFMLLAFPPPRRTDGRTSRAAVRSLPHEPVPDAA